jgi:hypothetical protein
MEPMVRPTRPGNWDRRNRLMNRQGTGWNRPEPEPEPETSGSGSKWNRNRVEPEPVGTGTEPAQPGPWPSLTASTGRIHRE